MLKHLFRGRRSGAVGDSWVATLGGSSYDYGWSVDVAPDGSVYVCGYTRSAGAGSTDLLLAKFSSSGTVQWQRTLGIIEYEYGRSVAVAPDGSVYVCGYIESTDIIISKDFLLAKFSSSGTVQWQKRLNGINHDCGRSVAVAPDGSVYVCGYTNTTVDGSDNLLLVKFNSSGTVQWQKTFGGSSNAQGNSIAVDPEGSVYVCGYTNSTGAGSDDLLLAKFNSSGTVQWQKTLGGSNRDYGNSVAVAPDGYVYVCGYTESAGAGGWDLLLAKFNSSGIVQWQKTLDGSDSDCGYSVAVAPDGSVYVCGYTRSAGAGNEDLLLAKFSSSGTVQWQKTLGGSSRDYGQSVAVAPDGSVYVCGYTNSAGAGGWDLLLAKITDSLIEKDIVTFGSFTFQDVSLTLENVSFTVTSPGFSVSNTDISLSVSNADLMVGTPSLTTNIYKE